MMAHQFDFADSDGVQDDLLMDLEHVLSDMEPL
jgi:hypothetical protein